MHFSPPCGGSLWSLLPAQRVLLGSLPGYFCLEQKRSGYTFGGSRGTQIWSLHCSFGQATFGTLEKTVVVQVGISTRIRSAETVTLWETARITEPMTPLLIMAPITMAVK